MSKLDLDWLGVFVEVYKTQSVSLAAQRRGMAQANASIALNKLRRHFNDRLFCRTSRGMEPTPRARAIYPELLEAWQRVEKARLTPEVFDPARAQRQFRICMSDISEVVLLPALVNHLGRIGPHIRVEAETTSAQSRSRLESGDVDLAVGFMPDLEAGFFQQALFAQDFVVMASCEHPRIQKGLTRHRFAAEGHIVVTTSGTGHSIVDKVLARHQVARRVVLRVPSFLGVARIVAQTDLLVVVPRLLGDALASQERVRLFEPPWALPKYKVKQHWHERFHADPGNAWLRQTMAQLFAGH